MLPSVPMLWTRSKFLLLAVAALGFVPLGWAATGAGRLGGDGIPGIVSFEVAGSAVRARDILDAWREAGVLRTAVLAVEWNSAFIVCYVLLVALCAAAAARAARPPWDSFGVWAAIAALAGGLFDFCENIALLSVLDGTLQPGASIAAVCAWTKFGLLGLALVLIGSVVFARILRRPVRLRDLTWTIAPPFPPATSLLRCDLVMKGGITSGVVYPGAVLALAGRYRFVNIGGSSAGALVAALTAAAEYRRRTDGTTTGFATLRDATSALAHDDLLFRLFQPSPPCAPLFDLATSALRQTAMPFRFVWVALTAATVFPLATLAGFVPALVLGLGASLSLTPGGAAWAFVAAALLSALFLPLALAFAAVWTAFRVLPTEGYGLCPGPTQGDTDVGGLSDWLADLVDTVAFAGGKESGPLTLGHLWCGGPPTDVEVRRRKDGGAPREINLEVLTTSLTHGRPYRIPFESLPLWFSPPEMRRVLPERVVEAMVAAGERVPPGRRPAGLPEGMVSLPPADQLPVVFLARMSLSFPFLLSATQLLGLQFPEASDGAPEAQTEATYEPHWFSDGGISSNFPIHFFDQPLPTWPTFGLDLGTAAPAAALTDRVSIPRVNNQGIRASSLPISGVPAFATALFSALHAWMDNMQKRVPGYRDRIARIDLTAAEGGLNLRMPGQRVLQIAEYGYSAGEQLGFRFDPGSGANPALPPWDNHRWIRFRSTLALLQRMLRAFRDALDAPQPVPTRTYREMLGSGHPPSYPYAQTGSKQHALELSEAIAGAPVGPPDLSQGAPRPEPELRIVPKV